MRSFIVLLAVAGAAACGGNQATEDPLSPIPTRVDPRFVEPPALRVEWRRAPELPPGDDEPILLTQAPAVGATLAYLPRDRELAALRLADGNEAWRLQLGVEITAQPLAAIDGVAVPTSTGWVMVDEGAHVLATLTSPPPRSAAATVDGVVQVDAGGVERLRLRPPEAAISIWRTEMANAATLAVTPDGALVIAIDDAGAIVALRSADGSVVWSSSEQVLAFRPAIYRDNAIVIGQDHRVRALRLRDGKRSWIGKEIGIRVGAAPIVVDGVIWVPGLDAAVHGYDWGGSHLFRVPMTGRVFIDLTSWGRWLVVSPQYGPWTLVRAPLQRLGPGDPGQPRSVTISSDGELSLRPGVGDAGVVVTDGGGAVRLLSPPPG